MKKLVTATLLALAGCGGGEFESAPGPAPDAGVEASTDALPESAPDVLAEAAPDAPDDTLPEPQPEAGSEPQPEAGPDAPDGTLPEPEPEPQPEAGPDAEPEPQPEAGPEPQPEAGPDAEPEAGLDAAQDAEAEAGFTCPTDVSRCVGLQPQQCVADHWEDNGGACTKECFDPVNNEAGCDISIDGLFDGPITEVVVPNADPMKVKVIGFKADLSTSLRWMYTPVITGNIYSTDDHDTFYTGTYNEAQAFCGQAMMLNPAFAGWELPTLTQFQGIMSQQAPVNYNERLVLTSVFWGPTLPAPVPACHWTRDQTTPGTHKAVWAPAGMVYDTSEDTVCAAWCVKPNP